MDIVEEVGNIFNKKSSISETIEIERLKDKKYDWRIDFFKNGKSRIGYLPSISPKELLEVYTDLLTKHNLDFGFIYFSEIPKEKI